MQEQSVAQFRERVLRCIEHNQLNEALVAIQQLVDQVFCEPLNTAQILGSRRLDALCQQIGHINLASLKKPVDAPRPSPTPRAMYIASKLQPSGGHTAALADMIRLSPVKENRVLLTGAAGSTDLTAIQHRFKAIENITFEQAPQGNHFEKLQWLQTRLREIHPTDVWLFNHHQDSVAVAAVQPGQGYQLHFYHHGDHHLCLGVHLDYADHVDPHPIIRDYCHHVLALPNSRYLPMVVTDLGVQPNKVFKADGVLRTCTAGGYNKVEAPYHIRYDDLVPSLLKASQGTHLHIGRLTPWMRLRLRYNLRKLGIAQSRLQFIPYVPSVWQALQQHQIDMYIASFPQGAGRTLIEAMGAGIPVVVHNHGTSRMFGGADMAYEDVFSWSEPHELYHMVNTMEVETLTAHAHKARKRYETYHHESLLHDALQHPSVTCESPPLHPYQPDRLQHALHVSNSITIKNMLTRFLRRTLRYILMLRG